MNGASPIPWSKVLSTAACLFAAFIILTTAFRREDDRKTVSFIPTSQTATSRYPDTEATQSIHLETYPGTVGQAAQLLELMSNEPGHSRYTLTFSAPGEVIVFGCDLNRQRLIRVKQRPGDHGTREMWHGHIIYRIQAASRGESLNHTPAGQIPGSFDTF